MTPEILHPAHDSEWDRRLPDDPRAGFFHTAGWARTLQAAYGYRPAYIALLESEQIKGLVPLMEIASRLTGRRAVGLPFSDFCDPLDDGDDTRRALLEAVVSRAVAAGWQHDEIRGGGGWFDHKPSAACYLGHSLALEADAEAVERRFKPATRRNIRRARRAGLAVELDDRLAALRRFHRLNCRTRRRHGLPPQPWRFFAALHEHVIAPGRGFTALAYHRRQPVAGAVFLHFRDQGLFKYGASDTAHRHLRPNNLVMREAVGWFCRQGFRRLHLGRTHPQHGGLLQFKRGWAVQEHPLPYYRWQRESAVFAAVAPAGENGYPLVRRLPLALLRLAGRLLYRHVG